jgi:uncharacterized protein (TIGR02996 family)
VTHEEAFLRAVCEAPDDPVPRLVYADWLEEHGGGTTPHLIRLFRDRPPRRREPLWVSGSPAGLPDGFEVGYHCGFVDAVRCGTALFLQHAAALFRAAPITEVRLGDVRPSRSWNEGRHSHVWTWWSPGNGPAASQVPAAVWRNLVPPRGADPMPWHRISVKDYPSPEAAHAALSAACTRYGRSLAGLPALAPA